MKACAFGILSVGLIMMNISPAQADMSGWYVGAHGEFLWLEDSELTRNGTKIGDLSFDMEYAAVGKVGYIPQASGFLSHTRYELEAMYRQTDLQRLTGTFAPGGMGGSIDTFGAMANMYYDIPTGTQFKPYIGGGVGYAHHIYDNITLRINDEDDALAYQGMLGIAYMLEAYPQITLNVGYRYYGTSDISVTNINGQHFEHDFSSHSVEYGIHYRF